MNLHLITNKNMKAMKHETSSTFRKIRQDNYFSI